MYVWWAGETEEGSKLCTMDSVRLCNKTTMIGILKNVDERGEVSWFRQGGGKMSSATCDGAPAMFHGGHNVNAVHTLGPVARI